MHLRVDNQHLMPAEYDTQADSLTDNLLSLTSCPGDPPSTSSTSTIGRWDGTTLQSVNLLAG